MLGAYEILAPLGAGGMGEGSRAGHLRLGREVAVKVLPERLTRDAKVLGGLATSHPASTARASSCREEERARTHYLSSYLLAYVHAGLGERETCLTRLETAVEERASWCS